MTIERMHQEIKLKWNKLNSNHKKDLPAAYLDDIINDSINDYIEIFYSGNNTKKYKLGFEVTQQRIDMLSSLVVPNETVAASLEYPSIYMLRLSLLNPKYRHFLRGSVEFDECEGKSIPINIIRHNDLDYKLRNENTKPSLIWERTLGLIKEDLKSAPPASALYIYAPSEIISDPISCTIEYIRKPVKVFSGGYDSLEYLNGDSSAYQSSDSPVNCDLPEDYHSIVVDIAVQNIARILEDINKIQITEEKIFKNV